MADAHTGHLFAHLTKLSHEELAELIRLLRGTNFGPYAEAFLKDGISGEDFAPSLEAACEENRFRPILEFFGDINLSISIFAARKLWNHLRLPVDFEQLRSNLRSKERPLHPHHVPQPQQQHQPPNQHGAAQFQAYPLPQQQKPHTLPANRSLHFQQDVHSRLPATQAQPAPPTMQAQGSAVKRKNNATDSAFNKGHSNDVFLRPVGMRSMATSLHAANAGLQQSQYQHRGAAPQQAASHSLGTTYHHDVHQQVSPHVHPSRDANAELNQQQRRSPSQSDQQQMPPSPANKQPRRTDGVHLSTTTSTTGSQRTSSHRLLDGTLLDDITPSVELINEFARSNVGDRTVKIFIPKPRSRH